MLLLGVAISPCAHSLLAAPVPFAGKIAINGLNVTLEAQFTFALRDANGIIHWRNGADANDGINVHVDRGHYLVLLGGQGMNALDETLFLEHPELYLEVRFFRADVQEWLHLQPDQRITSTPHALAADVANLAKLADLAKAVLPGAITKNMLAADVLADLNATVVLPESNAPATSSGQGTAIQAGSITRSMLAPGVLDDLNATIAPGSITANLLAPGLLDQNVTISPGSITKAMLASEILADLNRTISRSDLPASVLVDLNRTVAITRDMLPGSVLADLNKTITRNDLPASVLADLNRTLTRSDLPTSV
ncbi:MAG: hypothetical protein VB997_07920, partial [Opitutales bacterium]